MTIITVNRSTVPNVSLLHEELDALLLGSYGLRYPLSYPGNVIAEYDGILTDQQKTSVSDVITNHNETLTTTEEDRSVQDATDLDAIKADYDDDPTTWTFAADEAKILALLKKLARCTCRIARAEEI